MSHKIITPLNGEAWRVCLQDHTDTAFTAYILEGIEQGFHMGINRGCTLLSARSNMQSAREHAVIITKYLEQETTAAKVCGPFP